MPARTARGRFVWVGRPRCVGAYSEICHLKLFAVVVSGEPRARDESKMLALSYLPALPATISHLLALALALAQVAGMFTYSLDSMWT